MSKSPTINSAKPFRWRLSLSALLGGISLAMAVGLLGSSAWLITMASKQPPILILEVAIVSVRFFGLSRGVFRYGERISSHDSILRSQTALQVNLYSALEKSTPSNLTKKLGSVFHNIISDVELVQDRWLRIWIPFFSTIISGLAGIGIIYHLLPSAGVFIGITFLISIIFITTISTRFSLKSAGLSAKTEELISSQIANIANGHLEAKVFGYSDLLRKNLIGSEVDLNASEKKIDYGSGIGSSLNFIATGAAVIGGAYLSIENVLAGTLGPVNIAVITLLPLMIFDSISTLPSAFASFGKILEATSRIDSAISDSTNLPALSGSALIESGAINLKFTNARASWNSEFTLPHRPISTQVSPNSPLLLSGYSGIGKSSLALATMGLIPYEGSIKLNGIEIGEINREELTNSITLCMQDDHLFNSSIRENLKIGNVDVSDSQIWQALECVEISELISILPDGLDTHIGVFGENFSGGEKQRMRLARALLKNTQLVILDEPFEYLESDQISRISRNIMDFLKNKSLIIISHQKLDFSVNSCVLI